MKTPITYYGGKQSMLSYILPLIPPHKVYVEAFAGGAAVFWGKEKSDIEVINDTNHEVINFYEVLQKKYSALHKEIRATLHSRELFKHAAVVYAHPELFTPVKRAWALWVLANQGFGAQLNSGWRYGDIRNTGKQTTTKRKAFTQELQERIEHAQIECDDAIAVIKRRDTTNTFFYCDPPYFNANMGHYKGYSQQDFTDLLETLAHIKGTFLLSSYPSEILKQYTKKYGWKTIAVKKKFHVQGMIKEKPEVLTMNYEAKEK